MEGKKKKIGFIFLFLILLGFVIFIGIRYFYVFGEGVKTGHLNYVVKKGYIFKTYEGKLIQSGFRSQAQGSLGSNEFEFSVDDKKIAEELMSAGGQEVELHYKEYLRRLPWRGHSRYVVNEIVNKSNTKPNSELYLEKTE